MLADGAGGWLSPSQVRQDGGVDFAGAGLLDGLDGDERTARLELLERLAAEGVGLEELRAAVAEDRLVLLPLERELGARYTAAEVAQRTGLEVDRVIALRRALGLPEPGPGDRVFGEEDLDAYRALKLFFDSGLPEESITELTRVLGEGMARFAAGVARPGGVLCTQEVRAAAPDAFAWSFAGRHRLKGIPEPVPLHRARRLSEVTQPDRDTGWAAEGGSAGAIGPKADRPRRRGSRSRGS